MLEGWMQGVAATTSFWDSFWPGLVSGVVSGLFVSVAVGLLLYRMQTAFEERQVRASDERDVNALKARLSEALARRDPPSHLYYSTASLAVPSSWVEAGTLLLGMPIHQWRHTLPAASQFFDTCDALLRARDIFIRVAADYDEAIDEAISTENLKCPGPRVHAFLVASTLERTGGVGSFTRDRLPVGSFTRDRKLLVASGAPADMSEESLREDLNKIIIEQAVVYTKGQFEKAWRQLDSAVLQLKKALGMPS
jgi:hypothetical protein